MDLERLMSGRKSSMMDDDGHIHPGSVRLFRRREYTVEVLDADGGPMLIGANKPAWAAKMAARLLVPSGYAELSMVVRDGDEEWRYTCTVSRSGVACRRKS